MPKQKLSPEREWAIELLKNTSIGFNLIYETENGQRGIVHENMDLGFSKVVMNQPDKPNLIAL